MVKLGRDILTENYGFSIGDLDYYSVRNSCILFGKPDYYCEEDVDSIISFLENNPDTIIYSYDINLIKLMAMNEIEIEFCEKNLSNYNNSDFIDNLGRSIEDTILLPRYIRRENLNYNLLHKYNIIQLGDF